MTAVTPARSRPVFRAATILWALGASIVMALAFIAVATFAPELRESGDAGATALSRSAVGYAGMVRLLRASGVPAMVRRGPATPPGDASLLVLTPPVGADPDAVRAAAAYKGSVLIVAPKWLASASEAHPGWVVIKGQTPSKLAALAVTRPEVDDLKQAKGSAPLTVSGAPGQTHFSQSDQLAFGNVEQLQSRGASENGVPLLQDANGNVVLMNVDGGHIFVLTDPDLIDNHGLANIEGARSALQLISQLRAGDGPVEFDVTLNGLGRPRSLLRMALTPPFFAATLCALIACGLIGWRAAVRFGPTVRPGRAVALGKLALVDNSAGLLRLTRREAKMAPRYAAVVRGFAAQAVGLARDGNVEQTDAYLDKLSGAAPGVAKFSDLVTEADRSGGDIRALMSSAQNLFQWKSEITRERR